MLAILLRIAISLAQELVPDATTMAACLEIDGWVEFPFVFNKKQRLKIREGQCEVQPTCAPSAVGCERFKGRQNLDSLCGWSDYNLA